MDRDPWIKARLRLDWQEKSLPLLAPHAVFSSSSIDEGTRFLLDHLPPGAPQTFLDLGCGYGALGLPVAARFPEARGVFIDRDLLAVEFCRRNAAALGVESAAILPSLGYRDLPATPGRYDWILANLPARAGEKAMASFIAQGRGLLEPGGELRIVVIQPLGPAIEAIGSRQGADLRRIAGSPRHVVYSAPPGDAAPADGSMYERDRIELRLPEPLQLARPTDLADEPHRLPDAIPLLAEALPAGGPGKALSFRCGYGLLPALLLARYPGARVAAADRDLLAGEFTRLNCREAGERLRVFECLSLLDAAAAGPFDLIVGELSPPLGPGATLQELAEARRMLAPGGQLLALGLAKQWREFLRSRAAELNLSLLGTRGPAGLFQMKTG